MCVALVLFGASHNQIVLLTTCLIAGFAWLIVLTSLYVSAQQALPGWVRARGLAVLLTIVFGSVSVGSVIWGKLASADDPSTALYVAAAGLLVAVPLTWKWKLQAASGGDLAPSLHWRKMALTRTVDGDEGPILVTVEYRVNPARSSPHFCKRLRKWGMSAAVTAPSAGALSKTSKTRGATWRPLRLSSWLELRRMRERVTKADREIEEKIALTLTEPRQVRFHVAPHDGRSSAIVDLTGIQVALRMLAQRTRKELHIG